MELEKKKGWWPYNPERGTENAGRRCVFNDNGIWTEQRCVLLQQRQANKMQTGFDKENRRIFLNVLLDKTKMCKVVSNIEELKLFP